MRPAVLARLLALLSVGAVLGTGCAHTRQPVRKVHVIAADATGAGSQVDTGTGGAGAEAYCNELEKQCFTKCWRRKPELSSIEKGSGKHYAACTEACRKVFMSCLEEQEALERQESQKVLRFPTMDEALDWLRAHKTEVAVGTVVVVGAVLTAPYAVAVVGGALVLSPL